MSEYILVVGSEPSLRETLVRLLALEGHRAESAMGVEEALERLANERLSLVFIDQPSLGSSSVTLVQKLRFKWPQVGSVLLTDDSVMDAALELIQLGADDCLSRSRCRVELPLVLKRVLRLVELRKQNRSLRASRGHADERDARHPREGLRRLARVRRLTLRTLMNALGVREEETRRHSQRVADYTLQIAERMGLGARERRDIYRGALLHDLGKIGIPDGILLKPGPLSNNEWAVMHSHPRLGHNILRELTFLRAAAECSLCHHERWDGGGYPLGLSEGEIPQTARIVAVADALDAMSVKRPYRGPLSWEDIVNELVTNRGTQFDPQVVDVSLKLYRCWDDLHPEAVHQLRRSQARHQESGEPNGDRTPDVPEAA